MAISGTVAALTSSSSHKHHVFLSFRGKDTRKNFMDHFYTALIQNEIHPFLDEHELEKGINIRMGILKAIKESEIAVIIFSKNFGESDWCLDELLLVMMKMKMTNTKFIVIPVFYDDVQPFHVQSQTGSFGEGFSKHEGCKSTKIDKWRAALREVADLPGIVLQSEAHGYESQFIQEIIQQIKKNLNQTRSQNSNPDPYVEPNCLEASDIVVETQIQNSNPKPNFEAGVPFHDPDVLRRLQAINNMSPRDKFLEACKNVSRTPMFTRLGLLRNL